MTSPSLSHVPQPTSVMTRRHSLRAPCVSSVASTFLPESPTPRPPTSMASKTLTAAALSPQILFRGRRSTLLFLSPAEQAWASSPENRSSTTAIPTQSTQVEFQFSAEIWLSAELELPAFLMTPRNLLPSAAQLPRALVTFRLPCLPLARSSSVELPCRS